MCGIVGYVGHRDAGTILYDGLRRLEYRGYDSAGIAVLEGGEVEIRRAVGKLDALREALDREPLSGAMGIGHTRWATHGRPAEHNAHPHADCHGNVVVVHNGIVENYVALRDTLRADGHRFASETDTEVIAHLLEKWRGLGHDLPEALCRTLAELRGNHAILAIDRRVPDLIVAARLGNAGGLTIGFGKGETFVASDLPAILDHTRDMAFLDDGEMATIEWTGARFAKHDGTLVNKTPTVIPWDPIGAARGGYRHFMLKEIHEQPRSLSDTIGGRISVDPPATFLDDLNISDDDLRAIQRVVLLGCGTAWHACLCGKFMIEELARIPCEADYADEFRYREPIVDAKTLVIAVTQSGESVDVLVSMAEAKRRGARVIAAVNVVGCQASRVADGVIYLHAGPEIAVASTKAFTSMLAALALVATRLGAAHGTLRHEDEARLLQALIEIPGQVAELLERDAQYEHLAELFHRKADFLFLGRGISYVIALEGALKLKEISYIHAEGYPAGEMKHGPIALIDEDMPVVAIAPSDRVYDKIVNNIEQVKARGGTVIAIATDGNDAIKAVADHVIYVPATDPRLSPILTTIPCQLLAYYMAVRRGCDVDQPRNLAKSVTVE
ncbi:MAG: glutamine--fructose-6-phosphate transaminase (isomerizing) [Chloroflexota bacterium]|nr:MAG: glutamine--fructose-6-phosphate transaminase (isomerizing) [Chloroflexota bacterium]